MKKQDKQGVRTPEDVERKYGLGKMLEYIERLKTFRHVTFYNADGIVEAAYVINKGDSIKSPIANAVWVDSSGATITFPYTPTSNVKLYIQESTQ
jgi:hypothetical protein